MSLLKLLTGLNPAVLEKAKKLIGEKAKLEQRLAEVERELGKLEGALGGKKARGTGKRGRPAGGTKKQKSAEEIAAILQDMKASGLSIKQTAEKYGVAVPTVYKWTRESGEKPAKARKPRAAKKPAAKKKAAK